VEGWISLHRQVMENEFYFSEKFTKAQAWIDLLLLANHKPTTIFIRGIEIKMNPGDLCYSQLSLAKRWKWNFKTVKKFLDILRKRDMINYSGGKLTTVISIINWSKYQFYGEQKNPINEASNPDYPLDIGEQNGEQTENKTETDNNGNNVKTLNHGFFSKNPKQEKIKIQSHFQLNELIRFISREVNEKDLMQFNFLATKYGKDTLMKVLELKSKSNGSFSKVYDTRVLFGKNKAETENIFNNAKMEIAADKTINEAKILKKEVKTDSGPIIFTDLLGERSDKEKEKIYKKFAIATVN